MTAELRNKDVRTRILAIGLVAAVGFFLAGCGKKDKQIQPAQVLPSAPPGELPELEQNKIFLTNRSAESESPDYSYRETRDDLQAPSSEVLASLPPPVD